MRIRRAITAATLAGVAGVGGLAAAAPASAAPPPPGNSADVKVAHDFAQHRNDFRTHHDFGHGYFLAVCRERFFPHRSFLIQVESLQQLRFLEFVYRLDCRVIRFSQHG